ncbi:MAG: APC family permease [Acidobacteriota bacterium]
MREDASHPPAAHLHRALGIWDLVFLNVSCIFGFSSLAQVAQFGYGSLLLFVLAILTFLIPSGLMVAELNARMPEEGGLYLWTGTAFGDLHGYVAAWTYWLSNIVWMPTIMLLVSISCLYVFGDRYLSLQDNSLFNGIVCLAVLWGLTALNVLGIDRAKWVQNVGAVANWACILLLLVVGSIFVLHHGSSQPFSPDRLLPDLTDFSLLPYFAIVAFCFGGLELAPIMAGEIKNPKRDIPRAIAVSSVAVGLIYMVGTLMLILIVPEGEIGIIEGVTQAFHLAGAASSVPWGTIGGILVVLGTLGLLGSWFTGTARIPFVVGLDHYLPDAVAKVHPRWGSPINSLLMQATVMTVLFVASVAGSTVTEAFLVLLDMSIILYFIPFLYLFASLVWHMKKNTGGGGVIPMFQRSMRTVWVVAALGFTTTLLSTIISAVPTKDIDNKVLFMVKVVGGAVVLIGVGLVVYYKKKRDEVEAPRALAP